MTINGKPIDSDSIMEIALRRHLPATPDPDEIEADAASRREAEDERRIDDADDARDGFVSRCDG